MARDISATWQTYHILHRKLGFQIRNGYVQNIGTHLRDNQTDVLLGVRQRWRIEVHLELERSQQSVVIYRVILRWEACIYSCEEWPFISLIAQNANGLEITGVQGLRPRGLGNTTSGQKDLVFDLRPRRLPRWVSRDEVVDLKRPLTHESNHAICISNLYRSHTEIWFVRMIDGSFFNSFEGSSPGNKTRQQWPVSSYVQIMILTFTKWTINSLQLIIYKWIEPLLNRLHSIWIHHKYTELDPENFESRRCLLKMRRKVGCRFPPVSSDKRAGIGLETLLNRTGRGAPIHYSLKRYWRCRTPYGDSS